MPNRQRLLEMALKGLQADRAKLDEEIAEIKRELGQSHAATRATTLTAAVTSPAATKRRRMSEEARRRISLGMKRRYAELKKEAAKTTKK